MASNRLLSIDVNSNISHLVKGRTSLSRIESLNFKIHISASDISNDLLLRSKVIPYVSELGRQGPFGGCECTSSSDGVDISHLVKGRFTG